MKHKVRLATGRLGVLFLAVAGTAGVNAGSLLNTADTQNGIYKIYSFTFDASGVDGLPINPITACPGSTYCEFFGFDPPAASNLFITTLPGNGPPPSGVINAVPGGIGPTGTPVAVVPVAGSWLDLVLGPGNTTLTLNRGFVALPDINIKVPADGSRLDTNAHLGGFVFADPGPANDTPGASPPCNVSPLPRTPTCGGSTGKTVPIVGGVAVFEIQQSPTIMADFSKFSQVVTSCTGTQCALVTLDVLTLDMVRYVLEVTFNPTFTSYTAKFMGQTGNTSILFGNLNSVDVASVDTDADAIPDAVDNCRTVANSAATAGGPPQMDTNGEGYGNRCDPDITNDGVVNINDLNKMKNRLTFVPLDHEADLTLDGVININDINLLKSFLTYGHPGPSGLRPLCVSPGFVCAP